MGCETWGEEFGVPGVVWGGACGSWGGGMMRAGWVGGGVVAVVSAWVLRRVVRLGSGGGLLVA